MQTNFDLRTYNTFGLPSTAEEFLFLESVEQLAKLKKGDELTVGEVYGAIQYKGKGTFLAGGAGITPFIAIFNFLREKSQLNGNSLIFANKTEKDIFQISPQNNSSF